MKQPAAVQTARPDRPAMNTRIALVAVTAIFFMWGLIPFLQGHLVDSVHAATGNETAGLQVAFVLPALCYAYIVWYGLRGSRRA